MQPQEVLQPFIAEFDEFSPLARAIYTALELLGPFPAREYELEQEVNFDVAATSSIHVTLNQEHVASIYVVGDNIYFEVLDPALGGAIHLIRPKMAHEEIR